MFQRLKCDYTTNTAYYMNFISPRGSQRKSIDVKHTYTRAHPHKAQTT